MAELEAGEVFEMIVQQPGMVKRGLENQRFTPGNSRAVAAMNRARGQLRARHHIRLAVGTGAEATCE